jgi:hypothetical protein
MGYSILETERLKKGEILFSTNENAPIFRKERLYWGKAGFEPSIPDDEFCALSSPVIFVVKGLVVKVKTIKFRVCSDF